jgi:DNA-binding GntR family transcriptional regulator
MSTRTELPEAPGARFTRVSTGDLVASKIRSRIFDGELRAGDRIRQDELAREFGISRIPIREAFIALEREGWVTTWSNRGTFVEPFDDESIRVHFEVQGLVWSVAARHAATRASAESIVGLRRVQQRLVVGASAPELRDAHDEFEHTLLETARSPRLASALRSSSSVVPGNLFEIVPGSDVVQARGAARIVDAIELRDHDAAARACEQLAQAQASLVIEVVRITIELDEPGHTNNDRDR